MAFLETYLICALGIVVSIILPILRQSLPRPANASERGEAESFLIRIWHAAKPYLIVGVFSLITALLIVALGGDTFKDWKLAFLAGYAWDSTLQKARG
jgi:hypothetical protein